jgi:hypothetical protein
MSENYFYVVRLGLTSDSFKDYKLLSHFPHGYEAELTSQNFLEYKDCSDACNLLMSDMAKEITGAVKKEHIVSWELNPSLNTADHTKQKVNSTQLGEWKPNELLRLYVISPSKIKKVENIIPTAAMASIFTIEPQKSSGQASKSLH